MYLIVGLGNPGREYEHTRHNAGFDTVTLLAERLGASLTKLKCKALVAETRIGSERVVLAQPQTFMNLSGQSVVELMNWYKCDAEHLIVIYDDIDLDAGRLRVRAKGSAGTHNGMRNIIYLLGRDDFPRVRVGVGAPDRRMSLADYVLSRYATPELRQTMLTAFQEAGQAAQLIVEQGVEAAVRQVGAQAGDTAKQQVKAKRPSFGALAKAVSERVERGTVSGMAYAVAQDGRTLYQGIQGFADQTHEKKLHKDSLFALGHLTMAYTAAALLLLAERGQVRLEQPLADFLPEFEHLTVSLRDARGQLIGSAPARRLLTLRDLLSHCSGLCQDAEGAAAYEALWAQAEEKTLCAIAPQISRIPLAFRPGERVGLSEADFDLLARVVELASGMSFATFLNLEMFAPLGMGETTFAPNPAQRDRLVGAGAENFAVRGATGLYASVGDCLRFAQMLQAGGGRVLSQGSVQALCAVQAAQNLPGQLKSSAWGLGVRVCTRQNAEQPLPVGSVYLENQQGGHFFVDFAHKLCAVGLTARTDSALSDNIQDRQRILDALNQ